MPATHSFAEGQAYPNGKRRPGARKGPLAGVRVTDFCWMGVGAVATRMLADFGAEVIRIEARDRLDMPRRLPIYMNEPRTYGEEDANPDPNKAGLFNNYNRNKLGITINIRSPRGRELADRLISVSSVVTENFAPDVMERWGYTYEKLATLSPELIYARMSGYGHSGPDYHYRSYGPVVQAVSGLSFISGLPDREPSGWGLSYMDNQAAYYNSAAVMMAILNRNRTGKGCEIDVSAVDVGASLLGPDLLDVTVNDARTRRPGFPMGNRLAHPAAAPHGVYPARGDDRWIAIAVFNQNQWENLVAVLGHPEWASEARFAHPQTRYQNQDDLDKLLGACTAQYDAHELMTRLQSSGVVAGAAQNSRDLCETDPQIADHGTFFELEHPVIGPAKFEGMPMKFTRTVQENWRSAPLLGEDNAYVFGEILGLDEREIAELAAEGAI